MASTLSARGLGLIASAPMPQYIDAHFEHMEDHCDPVGNPDGYIGLCVAENKLVWDLVRPRLTAARTSLPHEAICYDEMIGSRRFREQLGEFMGRTFLGRVFPPEQIAALAGTGSILEILFHNIADSGDAVLVPTPSYAGFWADLETRDELNIVPVHTRSEDGFRLTPELLDEAYERSEHPVKVLLYTNPDNPKGTIADAAEIEMVIEWADGKGIHLVVDEVYALSVHGDAPFVSAATLLPTLGDRVHLIWAFSKDFGASGLRCGVLITENEELMQAMGALGYWSLVSGDTQYILGEMISDQEWVNGYLDEMRAGLRTSYGAVTAALDEAGIQHLPAAGGFFLLCDLREYLEAPTWEAEDTLWHRLVDEARVNLTPGSACRIGEPGFMRICFATEPTDVVVTAVERIAKALT
jgi:aspartate/methionine/tyrosine aminotransferase